MKVWRIEYGKDGSGPWRSSAGYQHGIEAFLSALSKEDRRTINPMNHPGPVRDGGRLQKAYEYGLMYGHCFGMKNLKTVKQWFNSAKGRRALDEAGYVLRQYEVDRKHVLEGNSQIAFIKHHATMIQERILT